MTDTLAPALGRALAARARSTLEAPGKTVAAVLVPLLAVGGEPQVLFIRRSADQPHHQGQVAFPGGVHQPAQDPDLRTTALREAHEEIGLRPEQVQLLGALDDIETVSSRFLITPFVGIVPGDCAWQPCPREVDAIFTVPLRVLQQPDMIRREVWDFEGRKIPIDSYAVEGHVIWGATFRITQNLLQVIGALG